MKAGINWTAWNSLLAKALINRPKVVPRNDVKTAPIIVGIVPPITATWSNPSITVLVTIACKKPSNEKAMA
jgi:hypothetical protein